MEAEPRPLHIRYMLGTGKRSGERVSTGETIITSFGGWCGNLAVQTPRILQG